MPTLIPTLTPPILKAGGVRRTPFGTIMTDDYVAAVGRLAYLWGWPLVNHVNRRNAFAKVSEPGRLGGVLPCAPIGHVGILYDYIDSAERFVTCPNQDTVYGAGL